MTPALMRACATVTCSVSSATDAAAISSSACASKYCGSSVRTVWTTCASATLAPASLARALARCEAKSKPVCKRPTSGCDTTAAKLLVCCSRTTFCVGSVWQWPVKDAKSMANGQSQRCTSSDRCIVAHAEQGFTANVPLRRSRTRTRSSSTKRTARSSRRPRLAGTSLRPESRPLEVREVAAGDRADPGRPARLLERYGYNNNADYWKRSATALVGGLAECCRSGLGRSQRSFRRARLDSRNRRSSSSLTSTSSGAPA